MVYQSLSQEKSSVLPRNLGKSILLYTRFCVRWRRWEADADEARGFPQCLEHQPARPYAAVGTGGARLIGSTFEACAAKRGHEVLGFGLRMESDPVGTTPRVLFGPVP
jgi:hypothetical protein